MNPTAYFFTNHQLVKSFNEELNAVTQPFIDQMKAHLTQLLNQDHSAMFLGNWTTNLGGTNTVALTFVNSSDYKCAFTFLIDDEDKPFNYRQVYADFHKYVRGIDIAPALFMANEDIIESATAQYTAFDKFAYALADAFHNISIGDNENTIMFDSWKYIPKTNELKIFFDGTGNKDIKQFSVHIPNNSKLFDSEKAFADFHIAYWVDEPTEQPVSLNELAGEIIESYLNDSEHFYTYAKLVATNLTTLAGSVYTHYKTTENTRHCITMQFNGVYGPFDIAVSNGMIVGEYNIYEWFSKFENWVTQQQEAQTDEPTTILAILGGGGATTVLSTDAYEVRYDDTIWSGDARYILSGTTAVVLDYYAETQYDDRDYKEGRKVVERAIKLDKPQVSAILFNNAIDE
ncbi:hypothetical protein [Spirosoma fluviale]|nr:hypothetical protein [Spirosoma fluviale]